jgi:hypothetical protein
VPSPPSLVERDSDIPPDPERTCVDFIRCGELKLAFSTMLRHMDSIAKTKAERNDVTGKATKKYTESLSDRLTLISGHEIDDATHSLRCALSARLASFQAEFREARAALEGELGVMERNVAQLNRDLEDLKRYKELPFETQPRARRETKAEPRVPAAQATPRKQTLHRSLQRSHKRIVQWGRAAAHPRNPDLGAALVVGHAGKGGR